MIVLSYFPIDIAWSYWKMQKASVKVTVSGKAKIHMEESKFPEI